MPSDHAKAVRWCAAILLPVLTFLVGLEKSAAAAANAPTPQAN